MALQYVCRDVHRLGWKFIFDTKVSLRKLFVTSTKNEKEKTFVVLWSFRSVRQQVLHEFLMMDVHYMQAFVLRP